MQSNYSAIAKAGSRLTQAPSTSSAVTDAGQTKKRVTCEPSFPLLKAGSSSRRRERQDYRARGYESGSGGGGRKMQLFHTQTSQTQSGVANSRTARSPQCLHSGEFPRQSHGAFPHCPRKKIKEKYSHRLSRDGDRPSNFFLRTKPQGKVQQISLFCFYLSSRSAPCNNNCMVH